MTVDPKKLVFWKARSRAFWTVTTIAALIGLKTLFELTPWGEFVDDKTYTTLLSRFSARGTTTRPDVLVIDISAIAREPRKNRSNDMITPRGPIQDLIAVLTELHPKAVGVDVDFSPDNQLIDPDDPKFFQWCFERMRQTGVRIFLGVLRSAITQDKEWLSDGRYYRLAGFIGVDNSPRWREHWPDRATYWLMAGNDQPLRSMSAALAGIDLDQLMHENARWRWLNWAMKPTSIIDFAPVTRIKEDALYAETPVDANYFRKQADKIRNRIVLLGDIKPENCDPKEEDDCFYVTGIKTPVHGVFLHACAAMTILHGTPIYELTFVGRILADAILAIVVLIAVQGAIWFRSRLHLPIGRLEHIVKDIIFTSALIATVVIVALICVGYTSVLWTDFIVVCLVLFVQLIIDIIADISKGSAH
jgi:CHASE2 domain-containing sensor protein